jgi:aryl-alcohol dehydrogenase-like predicted oxidoreductase
VKLALGTVQFGLNYGAFNLLGKPSSDEVKSILSFAAKNQIHTLDTAAAYGESEKVLGECMTGSDWQVVTKIPPVRSLSMSVEQSFANSLLNLGRSSVYALMMHSADDLLGDRRHELWNSLCRFKHEGKVEKIGISIYREDQVEQVLKEFPLEIVQVPISILDQRLLKSGCLGRLKDREIEVHARSIFLQGLVLRPVQDLKPFFDPMKPHLTRMRSAFAASGLTSLEASLAFIRDSAEIDKMVVGVESTPQLQEIVSAYKTKKLADPSQFAWTGDVQFLNPGSWK